MAGSVASRVSGRRVYSGQVIDVDVDAVRLPNGVVVELEIIRHPGASAVLPFISDPREPDPRILLIQQYRYAAGSYVYEVPAGRLMAGEDPVNCARRELKEETGYAAATILRLGGFFTTPGFTDEYIHAFAAEVTDRGDTALERDELIRTEEMPLSTALSMVSEGRIVDAKTMATLLLATSSKHRF